MKQHTQNLLKTLGFVLFASQSALVYSTPVEPEDDADDYMSTLVPADEPVFEEVSIFEHENFYSRPFQINAGGTYLATLTDFNFPRSLETTGINVTTTTKSLGMLTAPGYFTFDADPGNYFLSFFGKASHLGQYGIDISRVISPAASSSPVPLPAAVWLFGSGLLGLVGLISSKPAEPYHAQVRSA